METHLATLASFCTCRTQKEGHRKFEINFAHGKESENENAHHMERQNKEIKSTRQNNGPLNHYPSTHSN